jgi:hypothetical protein
VIFFLCLIATVAFPFVAVADHLRVRSVAVTLGLILVWLPVSVLVLGMFPDANLVAYTSRVDGAYNRFTIIPLFMGAAHLFIGYLLFHLRFHFSRS